MNAFQWGKKYSSIWSIQNWGIPDGIPLTLKVPENDFNTSFNIRSILLNSIHLMYGPEGNS